MADPDTGAPPAALGVALHTAGFFGPTLDGPVGVVPLASYAEFERTFAGALPGSHLGHALRGFFENGGQRACVARVKAAGAVPDVADYLGTAPAPGDPGSGLGALEADDDIALLCCPDEHAFAPDTTLAARMVAQCERLRSRMAILQAPREAPEPGAHEPGVRSREGFAAYYHPWIEVAAGDATAVVPPAGHVMGLYARTELALGLHKAPAGAALAGALGLATHLTSPDLDLLTTRGVDCLREVPARGVLVWGARTTSLEPEWRYVTVRRLCMYVEVSLQRGLAWAEFEPNAPPLWERVVTATQVFLFQLWRSGALAGATPDKAFYVRCDRTTMSQDDLDAGRLVLLVGVAPLRAAEFVLVRIGQWTGSATDRDP